MLIGLTYDLRADYLAAGYTEEQTAEFDRAETVEALESTLAELGHRTERIGSGRQLVDRLAAGRRWDLVFNFAEGLHGLAREAQVPAILDLYEIPYTFSDPLVLALTLHKALTKVVVRAAGIPTPEFALVHGLDDLQGIELPMPLFAKPVAEGTGKGVTAASKIVDRDSLTRVCGELLARYRQDVLVETFLPGREFTVGVLGTGADARVVGSMEVFLLPGAEAEVYSYVNKERSEELCRYQMGRPEQDDEVRRAEELALAVHRRLGCRDASRTDFRSDGQGRPQFIEINPLAGLHPEHSDLPIICGLKGIGYRELVERIVSSAARRAI
ncbi:MAG: D-alanine--D-alanine ligase [Thermoguttaceae bacterium]|jgi:D-alanine-D-alanine ligase